MRFQLREQGAFLLIVLVIIAALVSEVVLAVDVGLSAHGTGIVVGVVNETSNVDGQRYLLTVSTYKGDFTYRVACNSFHVGNTTQWNYEPLDGFVLVGVIPTGC